VPFQSNVTDFCSDRRVDDRERAAAIADDDPIAGGIDPNVVGVIAEVDATQRRQVVAQVARPAHPALRRNCSVSNCRKWRLPG
jgi:hypothetical protein